MSLVGPDILIVAVRYPRSQPTGLRGLERVDILRPPQGGGFQPQSSRTALLVRGSSPSPTAQEGSPRCHRMPCGGRALRRLGYRRRLNDGTAARRQNGREGRGASSGPKTGGFAPRTIWAPTTPPSRQPPSSRA